jgi:tripartite-type tricarboxylate transporter receptor subunit TctC
MAAFLAHADAYPERPVRIVVPYAAGGGVDAAARAVAQHLSSTLGQNFIVEAKPGGGTIIGTDLVARSPADGYTLLIAGGSTMSLLPLMHQGKLPYDPLNDFVPVGMVVRIPYFLITSSSQPYKSTQELMDAAKAKQGSLAYASNGLGGMTHLGTEVLLQIAGVKMVHVPYSGFAPALSDLVTGRVSMVMADLAPVNGQLQAGTLRALAVASSERSRFRPEIPTLKEIGYTNSVVEAWLALFAPARTPPEIVSRVANELSRFVASQAGRDELAKLGHEGDSGNAEVVRTRIMEEQRSFAPAVRAAGLANGR